MTSGNGQSDILQDLQEGHITAEEANERLAEIEANSPVDDSVQASPLRDYDLPHISEYRRGWKIGLLFSLIGLAFTGSKVASARRQKGFFARLRGNFYGLLFALSGLLALLAVWSRDARWLLVHIEERDGKRLDISLPVPLHLIGKLLSWLRPLVNAEDKPQVEAAIEFIKSMQDEMDRPDGQPVVVDIDDDGQRVQVFLL